METVRLQDMTWPEVESFIAAGRTTCVVVSASIEQHGPHLPLATDTLLGEALGEALARRLGNALVAPVIRPGCSDHHMAFPGSLTLPKKVFQDVLRHVCISLAQHGFTRLVLVSSHGGNFAPILEAAAEIQAAVGDRTLVVPVVDLVGFLAAMNEPFIASGSSAQEAGHHAGRSETAMVAFLHPERVRRDKAEMGYLGDLTDEVFTRGLKAFAANGILGDARDARAVDGERAMERLVDYLAAEVRRQVGPALDA